MSPSFQDPDPEPSPSEGAPSSPESEPGPPAAALLCTAKPLRSAKNDFALHRQIVRILLTPPPVFPSRGKVWYV